MLGAPASFTPTEKRTAMSFLDSDLLARIHERAADADATNTYPERDLADLRDA